MDNDSLVSLFLSQQDSDATKATYERGLVVFREYIKDKPLDQVTDVDLIGWKDQELSNMNGNTAATRWKAVTSFYKWLTTSGRLPVNPTLSVKGPHRTAWRPRAATESDVSALLDTCSTDTKGTRDRAMLALMANGLRVSEVVALTPMSIRKRDGGLTATVVGKGQKTRDVPLGKRATDALYPWLAIRENGRTNKLFYDVWADGYAGPLTVRMVQSAVEKARRRAKLPHVTAQTLRHYYATTLVRNGANVFAVQRLLGHSSVSTTQTYISLDTRDLEDASRLAP